MSTQTYCNQDDLELTWTPDNLVSAVDDDSDGSIGAAEEESITRAIERAANLMNSRLAVRYDLAWLVENAWCRDANAAIAAYLLSVRRGDPPPDHLQAQYEQAVGDLDRIAAGQLRVPQAVDLGETTPTVTNFDTELSRDHAKVRRVGPTSTGSPPPGTLKQFPAE